MLFSGIVRAGRLAQFGLESPGQSHTKDLGIVTGLRRRRGDKKFDEDFCVELVAV